MTKHVLDQSRPRSGSSDVREYVRIEKETGPEGSHRAAKTVHKRAVDRGTSQRLKEYTRIERGLEA